MVNYLCLFNKIMKVLGKSKLWVACLLKVLLTKSGIISSFVGRLKLKRSGSYYFK